MDATNPEVPDGEYLRRLSDRQCDLAIANRLLVIADNMHRMWLKIKIAGDPDDDPSAGRPADDIDRLTARVAELEEDAKHFSPLERQLITKAQGFRAERDRLRAALGRLELTVRAALSDTTVYWGKRVSTVFDIRDAAEAARKTLAGAADETTGEQK